MAVFQAESNLPEDRFVNTFHFHDATILPYDPAAAEAIARVESFYNDIALGSNTLGSLLSPWVKRTFSLQAYNLLLPPGEREPTIVTADLPAQGGVGLPEEVAVCLTLEGAAPVTARRRGRLYFGPLLDNPGTMVGATASGPARPPLTGGSSVGLALTSAASVLASSTFTLKWCIRSTTPSENYVPIVGGYVDNAFDTQRRRGPDPSTRLPWTPLS